MLNKVETARRVCQTRSDDETEEEKTMDRILLALVLQPSLDIGAGFTSVLNHLLVMSVKKLTKKNLMNMS